ncbi:MAG: serine/threonine-protein kinase [Myxococcota bacterium]
MKQTLAFDKYRPLRRLAVGGMGEIFLAQQEVGLVPGVERWIVLKTVLPQGGNEDVLLMQFLDEAKVVASLNHPNIVLVHEVGVWDGEHTIALEFIDGVDLAELLTRLGRSKRTLPDSCIARIVRDAALALHHAHSAMGPTGEPLAIVHRDVSPQNLMLRRDGITKVLDFGVAKIADGAVRTASGVIKGKRGYMSPEQIHAETLDHRSDQFSLGIVFWELCTGERLFRGLSDLQVFQAILSGHIPPFAELGSPPRPELESVLRRMLATSREARFADCQEVAEVIEATSPKLASDRELASLLESEFPERTNAKFFNPRLDEIHSSTDLSAPTRAIALDQTAIAQRSKASLRLALFGTAALVAGIAVATVGFSILSERNEDTTLASTVETPPPSPTLPETETETEPKPVAPAPAVANPAPVAPKPRAKRRESQVKRVAPPGSLTLQTTPWTNVFVDGEKIGMTPIFELELPSGVRKLRLVNEKQGIDERTRVKIRPGRTERLKLDFAQKGAANARGSAP